MPETASVVPDKNPAFEELVRALGQVFTSSYLYGPNHGVTKKAMDEGYGVVSRLLDQYKELTFNVTEDGLLVNGGVVEQKNPLMKTFVTQLAKLEIKSFGLEKGMPRDKFEKLIEIMNTKPDELKKVGGFQAVVISQGLQGVRMSKVMYVQVAEDELVVSKKDLEAVTSAAKSGDRKGTIEGVFAFLKGEVAGGDENFEKNIRELVANSDDAADVVLRSARARQTAGGAAGGTGGAGGSGPGSGGGVGGGAGPGGTGFGSGGSTAGGDGAAPDLSDLVVDNVRKIYDTLMKDPAAKTQKGKKEIERELEMLENRVLARLREDGAESEMGQAGVAKITDAIEGMMDELKIEALATEYMKKRKAIETSESRILRFIKMKGLEKITDTDLQGKLVEGGLAPVEWKELLAKTGIPAADGATTVAGQNVDSAMLLGHLANLLTEMENTAGKGEGDAKTTAGVERGKKDIVGVLKEVSSELGTIVATTEQKIDNLVKDLRADAEAEASGGPEAEKKAKMPRKKLMVVLAEIGQELCQPLAVINCTLGLVVSEGLGEITSEQREMLNLAINSEEKLKQLADRLMDLSGVPTTLSPDSKIQTSLYK